MTSSETNAPYLSVFTHAGAPYDTLTTRLRVGNLNGYLGNVSDLYGIGIGETGKSLQYDPTNGLVLTGPGIEVGTSGYFRSSGKTSYADTDAGIWIGYDTDAYKVYIGDATKYIKWDGTDLTITGGLTADYVEVDTDGYVRTAGKTSYSDTDAGFWLGYDTTAYKFYIGDATDYIKWDGSNVLISTSKADGITLKVGADLKLEGDDSNPGLVKFSGSSSNIEIGLNAAGSIFNFLPSADTTCTFYLGSEAKRFANAYLWSETISQVAAKNTTYGTGWMQCISNSTKASVSIGFDAAQNSYLVWGNEDYAYGALQSNLDHGSVIGDPDYPFSNMYSGAFTVVADFYHLDSMDDLAELHKIKGSGVINDVTGLEIIDDDTLPEWMLHKSDGNFKPKEDPTRLLGKGDVLYNKHSGKPYLDLTTIVSLLMGAVRQLDKKVESMRN